MAGWLHGVFVGERLFIFPLCGFCYAYHCRTAACEVYVLLDGYTKDVLFACASCGGCFGQNRVIW